MPLVEIKDIYKTYKGERQEVCALQDVSLEIEKGDFLIIKGPSGSGKSTLMHILGLLDMPDKGMYLLEGGDVSDLSSNELSKIRNQKIGFVFQTFDLLPRMTVLDNVALPLLYGKKNKKWNIRRRTIEALQIVGLKHRLKHLSNQLSGGEKQRVAIARALINEPSIILADEPTGNLDSKSSKSIMDLLKKLNEKRKVTLVIVTHEPSIAKYGRRVMEIVDGRITVDHQNNL